MCSIFICVRIFLNREIVVDSSFQRLILKNLVLECVDEDRWQCELVDAICELQLLVTNSSEMRFRVWWEYTQIDSM